jgi:hypothetical protein
MTRADRHAQVVALKATGLTFTQITALLGVSRTTVTDAYYDPTGALSRERKRRRHGSCVDCGTDTFNSGGEPPKRCQSCEIERLKTDPAVARDRSAKLIGRVTWTDQQIFAAIRASARDGVASGDAYHAMRAEDPTAYPSMAIIYHRFDRWSLAVHEAGLRVRYPASAREYANRLTGEELAVAIRECAREYGRRPTLKEYRFWARSRGEPSSTTIKNRLGGWVAACDWALAGVAA